MSVTESKILSENDVVLVTGAGGFVGSRVVERLLAHGFKHIRCFTRTSTVRSHGSDAASQDPRIEVVQGNLLSREDCQRACKDVAVVYHLAAGAGEKSYPDAFMNSVVTTRNLLEACADSSTFRRFVNISSFAVYDNRGRGLSKLLDETTPVEARPQQRGEAYCYAKAKQDEIVTKYGRERGLKYVILRPGVVYGPGKSAISGRVGITTFGPFLHMGGSNRIPFTYVDNCAEAIARAGFVPGADGEVINIVDDNLPTSRQFLRLYKKNVRRFRSWFMPKFASYLLCWMWQKYCQHSHDQVPPAFSFSRWRANWKPTTYSNARLKSVLGWKQLVSTEQGLALYFEGCRTAGGNRA